MISLTLRTEFFPRERDLLRHRRSIGCERQLWCDSLRFIQSLRAERSDSAGRLHRPAAVADRREILAKLALIETLGEVAVHPGATEAYGRLASRLHEVMEGSEGEKVRAEVRKLIERVDFEPLEGLGRFGLQIHGKLAALLGVSERAAACEVILGAGTGFEPVTFRL